MTCVATTACSQANPQSPNCHFAQGQIYIEAKLNSALVLEKPQRSASTARAKTLFQISSNAKVNEAG